MSTDQDFKIALIAAIADNGVIGNQGKLPWSLPEDLRWFKENTLGKPIIMGRKTFESLGRVLPQRHHIIITRKDNYTVDHSAVTVVHNLADALGAAQQHALDNDMLQAFIIGGAEIYALALQADCIDQLYLTEVQSSPEGDAYFPNWQRQKWRETFHSQHSPSENNPGYTFYIFEKIL